MNPINNASSLQISCLYQSLYHIRRLGNCFGRAEQLASGAANFGTFVGGLLLSCACGKNETVRMTARIIQIATKVLAAVKAELAFNRHFEEFINAFTLKPYLSPYPHVSLEHCRSLSLHSQRRMAHMLNRLITMLTAIITSFLKILYYAVLISTYLLDLADTIQGKKEAINQSVRDIFINCSSCWNDTADLVQELCKYEVQVHHTLRFLGGAYESELISSQILSGCRLGAALCQPFVSIGGGVKHILGFQKTSPLAPLEKEVIL